MDLLVHLLAWPGRPPSVERCLFRHLQPWRLPEAPGRVVVAGPAALERVSSKLAGDWMSRGGRRLVLAVERCNASVLRDWLTLEGVEVASPEELTAVLSGLVREVELGRFRSNLEPADYLPATALPSWLTGDRRPATGDRRGLVSDEGSQGA